MLRGALAAALTPLREEGAALDEAAFRPYLDFLAAAGLDGVLALGTTGEGILLSAAELFSVFAIEPPVESSVYVALSSTSITKYNRREAL